jgi:cytochrome b
MTSPEPVAPSPAGAQPAIKVWDLPVRLFHWILVASIAVSFLSSEEESALADWHMPAGWLAAVLIAFRVVWGFVGGEHARFAAFFRPSAVAGHLRDLLTGRAKPHLGHNPAGGLASIALIVLPVAVIASGVALWRDGGEEDLHEVIAWSLMALVGLHVLAVVVTSVLSRDNLIASFITGRKPAAAHPGATDARPPPIAGFVIAAVAIAGAVAGILQIDPSAFTPKPREPAEAAEAAEAAEPAGDGVAARQPDGREQGRRSEAERDD